MRESLGSIWIVSFVFFVIILISGFLAFNTNYNKAFKMKNKIINVLEKHNNVITDDAQEEIREYAKSIGYSASSNYTNTCGNSGYDRDSNNIGWCYKEHKSSSDNTMSGDSNGTNVSEYKTTYIDVKTFVSIDIPIFNLLFPHINQFSVTGSTKEIRVLKR